MPIADCRSRPKPWLLLASGFWLLASTLFGQQVNLKTNVKGILPLANGGTDQISWTAGACVEVNATATALESAVLGCGSNLGGAVIVPGIPRDGQFYASQTYTGTSTAWQPFTFSFSIASTPAADETLAVTITAGTGSQIVQMGNAYLEFQ